MSKRKRFDLNSQLQLDIDNLLFQVMRLRSFLSIQKPAEESEKNFLSLGLEILAFLEKELRSSETTLLSLSKKEIKTGGLAPHSKLLAFIVSCIESLTRFFAQWRIAANREGSFFSNLDKAIRSRLFSEKLPELSYLLAFSSHAVGMDLTKPISIQLSMLEVIEMVYHPIPNHIQMMVASQDWDVNTNPFSMLRAAHDVMAIIAGSRILLGEKLPGFVLAPHCKSTVGRGPMMCHALIYCMELDSEFKQYRDLFKRKLRFLLGPKPINREKYMEAIEDSAAEFPSDSQLKTGLTFKCDEAGGKKSDHDELFRSLADRVPSSLIYRVPVAPAVGAMMQMKQFISTHYGHLRNAPKGAKNKYSYAVYDLQELENRLDSGELTHQVIADYLTSKRKMGYFKGGREGKRSLLESLFYIFDQDFSSLVHRSMKVGDSSSRDINRLLSLALRASSDPFYPDSALVTTGWYSKRRQDFEKQLNENHRLPGSSQGSPVRRVRRLQGDRSEADVRSGFQGMNIDQRLREMANEDLSQVTLDEKQKFKTWKETLRAKLPTLEEAADLLRGIVKAKKRDIPFKELQNHVKQYLTFAIESFSYSRKLEPGEKLTLEEEGRLAKECREYRTFLGSGRVRCEHINHMSKVVAMWLRQIVVGECHFPDLSDEAFSKALMSLPSSKERLFSSHRASKVVRRLPSGVLKAIKDILFFPSQKHSRLSPAAEFSHIDLPKEQPVLDVSTDESALEAGRYMHCKQHARIELGSIKEGFLSGDDLYEYRDISYFRGDIASASAANHELRARASLGRLAQGYTCYAVTSLPHLGFFKGARYFDELAKRERLASDSANKLAKESKGISSPIRMKA